MVFILYKLYILSPNTASTTKTTHHMKHSAFLHFQKKQNKRKPENNCVQESQDNDVPSRMATQPQHYHTSIKMLDGIMDYCHNTIQVFNIDVGALERNWNSL